MWTKTRTINSPMCFVQPRPNNKIKREAWETKLLLSMSHEGVSDVTLEWQFYISAPGAHSSPLQAGSICPN